MDSVAGKTVLITGCTRGLGRALVQAFGAGGARIAGFGRSSSALDELASESSDFEFAPFVVDVRHHQEVCSAVEAVTGLYGSVDVLFNNAALYPKENFLEQPAGSWAEAIETNLIGMANCCRAILPVMIAAGFGRIYNIGTWADLAPIPRSSAYAASKGGVHALTKAIAADLEELEPDVDVEVHEWIPGHLNTRMSDFTGIDPAVSAGWAVNMVLSRASSRNVIFENDAEWVPPKRLKERIADTLLFWR